MEPVQGVKFVNFSKVSLLAAALGIAITQIPGIATAATTWSFTSGNCIAASDDPNGCTNDEFDRSQTYGASSATGPDVTTTGWANTANNDTTLEQGWVARYGGGLGVRNEDWNRSPGDAGEGSQPEHAVDNDDRFDFVLFDFGGTNVSLTEISLGYRQTDADISVLAYTGSGSLDLTSRTYTETTQDLTTNGWELVGNYDVDSIDNSNPYTTAINANNVESSYWIVGAYNSVFGGCTDPYYHCQLSPYLDHFKIASISGIEPPDTPPNEIPLPGTLLLMSAAGLPLWLRRRRLFAGKQSA